MFPFSLFFLSPTSTLHHHRFFTTVIFFIFILFFEQLVTTIISFIKNCLFSLTFVITVLFNLCHLSIQPPSSQFSSTSPPSLNPSSLPHLRLDLRTLPVASLSSPLILFSSISHHHRPHPPLLSVVFNLKSYHHRYPSSFAILNIYSLCLTILQNALTTTFLNKSNKNIFKKMHIKMGTTAT